VNPLLNRHPSKSLALLLMHPGRHFAHGSQYRSARGVSTAAARGRSDCSRVSRCRSLNLEMSMGAAQF
jgi:hypothetical protein